MTDGIIFNIQRFSIHDGPGIRSTVFMKGCPLSCDWCHNPESQQPLPAVMHWPTRCTHCQQCAAHCPEQAISFTTGRQQRICSACGVCVANCPNGALEVVGRLISDAEVTTELLKDEAFYDQSGGGVTFSGGEPLAQPEFLEAMLRNARRYRWHTVVDTSGYAPWPVLRRLLPLVDLWLYDVKLMDDAAHQLFTGVSNRLILDNLTQLVALGSNVQVRVPVIPGVNDHEQNWKQLVEFLRPLAIRGIKLLGYHGFAAEKYARLGRPYLMTETVPPTVERLAELSRLLQAAGLPVV